MAEDLGIKTPNIIEKARKLCEDGDKVVETAKEAYKILKSNASLESKIGQLAELLKPYFHIFMKYSFEQKPKKYGKRGYVPAIKRLSPTMPMPEKLDPKDRKNPVRDPQWLIQMMALYTDVEKQVRKACKQPGKAPAFLVRLGIGYTGEVRFAGDDIIVEAARLSLYSRYVEAVEKVGVSGTKVEELEQWTLGDLPHELRVEETLRVYGEVLPPVFSLKFAEKEEPESGGRGGSVIIILDCSGSMGGIMRLAKQAAFSILQEARKRGDEVFLVFFSGNALPIPPGRSYEIYEKAVAAVVANGGTVLPYALRYALEYAVRAGKATTFIISDAGTSEVKISAQMVRELQKYGKVVFFWIGGAYGSYAEQWLRESGAKVYVVPFGVDFTEEALREAMW